MSARDTSVACQAVSHVPQVCLPSSLFCVAMSDGCMQMGVLGGPECCVCVCVCVCVCALCVSLPVQQLILEAQCNGSKASKTVAGLAAAGLSEQLDILRCYPIWC